jgi:hypothetical protein
VFLHWASTRVITALGLERRRTNALCFLLVGPIKTAELRQVESSSVLASYSHVTSFRSRHRCRWRDVDSGWSVSKLLHRLRRMRETSASSVNSTYNDVVQRWYIQRLCCMSLMRQPSLPLFLSICSFSWWRSRMNSSVWCWSIFFWYGMEMTTTTTWYVLHWADGNKGGGGGFPLTFPRTLRILV